MMPKWHGGLDFKLGQGLEISVACINSTATRAMIFAQATMIIGLKMALFNARLVRPCVLASVRSRLVQSLEGSGVWTCHRDHATLIHDWTFPSNLHTGASQRWPLPSSWSLMEQGVSGKIV